MSNIPCENCITLPICKAQVISHINTYSNEPYTMPHYYTYQNVLAFKCSIIKEWVCNKEDTFNHMFNRMETIQTLFTKVFKEEP